MRVITKTLAIVLIILTTQFCNESINDNIADNIPPNTFLFLYPDTGISQQPSRLQVHWWGDDPDGLVTGYYFKWEGLNDNWVFTSKNDSLFSLPIGTVDTNFSFLVKAVDNGGNGVYDNSIIQDGIDYGPEPFIDSDNNGVYSEGETFFDIGLIDPTPAGRDFPIKNSSPEIEWNEASSLPLESYPVVTVGWNADDLDGTESITQIHLALNDTADYVVLKGSTRLVTLRVVDIEAAEPVMEVLVNASEDNILEEQLVNLKLNDNNRIFIRAKDISGGLSEFIPLPDTTRDWFVRKPKGNLIIVDDYLNGSSASTFYTEQFNSLSSGILVDKYDVFDLETNALPYPNISFLETLKLFDYVYWYSNSSPDLSLANLVTQKFVENGGKIMYSLTFENNSADFAFDLATIQNFLPIDSLGQAEPIPFLLRGASVLQSTPGSGYPQLETSSTIGFVRTFHPSVTATEIYDISSSQVNGNIAFMDNSKSLFFIGLPLHSANAIEGSVKQLLEKIFFEEFGLSL
ncbi:MAG: hypothetical protein K9J16_10250 [Melioribacteraceae bacterium]|nr:hypothetical protein [Melioribacteraceae bacterium]MCF8353394.1 hypothetical protein [Melioribacteraceae bacterium]MCF8393027.1 hypothetical protein [Melioribacteraceae bacterium]MCF8419120.1 hypothetical protein [Melioribacteraceae bacterium]